MPNKLKSIITAAIMALLIYLAGAFAFAFASFDIQTWPPKHRTWIGFVELVAFSVVYLTDRFFRV